MIRSQRGFRRASRVVASLLLVGGCIAGPFERANPHDADAPIEMTIVGGADTLRVVGVTVLFQLVTDPITSGYTPVWTSTAPAWLQSLDLGRYRVMGIPPAPISVVIHARIGGNTAARVIVLAPAP
jgi:hypothetical protein